MRINDREININDAMKYANHDMFLLKHQSNGLLLSDYQLNVLKTNGFDVANYKNMQELLFDIEEYLNDEYNGELDLISGQLAEFIYYKDTKK